MRNTQRIGLLALLALVAATIVGLLQTGRPAATVREAGGATPAASETGSPVDQSPLKTAQRLSALATGPDERRLAQEVLRVADHEVDLAFAEALRQAAEQPPAPGAEVRAIQDRLEKAQKALRGDEGRVARLTTEAAGATGGRKEALAEGLELAKAQAELDRDEADDAHEDLVRAGGDPEERIQRLVREHESGSHGALNPPPAAAPAAGAPFAERGLVHQARRWMDLHQERVLLGRAKQEAESAAARLGAQHAALEERVGVAAAAPGGGRGSPAASVAATKRLSSERKALASLDKRISDEKELADLYGRWSAAVAAPQSATIHGGLLGVLFILLIALAGLVSDSWLEHVIGRVAIERRRVEQLRTLTRVTLRVVGVVLILLVVVGPPGQLATVVGLAGAGLTVALKDFIVGFIGWFVLMGKNGIRLGDWVEINGVSGEVAEIGPFHTVLLETGNWAASGHPTGRRVTFPNSFAVEGHYFNFSTSGQWLWDELQVHLPPGRDPYPIAEAISAIVAKETEANARLAEREWQQATRSKELRGFSAEPAVSVRPGSNGFEVVVRYMTRANERHRVRSRLYHAAVELLGRERIPSAPAPNPAPAVPRPATGESH